MSNKRKRNSIDIETKYKIIKDVEMKRPYKEITNEYNLKDTSNISRILQIKDKIISEYEANKNLKKKSLKTSKYPILEIKLKTFVEDCNASGINISRPIMIETAQEIATNLQIQDFKGSKGSKGHIHNFIKRNNIIKEKIRGDSGSVPLSIINDWVTKLKEIIKDYEPMNIFNADEFGLFYKLMPNSTYIFNGKKCKTGKISKERITVLVCANMNGSEKLKLVVIGKSQNPRCFKNIKKLPVIYRANNKSWMTSKIFTEVLKIWNNKFQKENRKFYFLLTNAQHIQKFNYQI